MGQGGGPDVRRFQGDIATALPEQMGEQGGLARLPWSCEDHSRELARGPAECRLKGAGDIALRHGISFLGNYAFGMHNCNSKFQVAPWRSGSRPSVSPCPLVSP